MQYGVPITFVGIAYVILITPWLLVRGKQALVGNDTDARDVLLGARLTQWAPAAGRSIQRSGLRDTGGIYLVRVKRAATGNIHHAVGPEFVLQVGDILYFTGLVESFGDFCSEHGLEVVTNEVEVGGDNNSSAVGEKDESKNSAVDSSETIPLTFEGLHPISEGNEPIPGKKKCENFCSRSLQTIQFDLLCADSLHSTSTLSPSWDHVGESCRKLACRTYARYISHGRCHSRPDRLDGRCHGEDNS